MTSPVTDAPQPGGRSAHRRSAPAAAGVPCRPGSRRLGRRAARSTTSAAGCRCRPPRPGACSRSITCSPRAEAERRGARLRRHRLPATRRRARCAGISKRVWARRCIGEAIRPRPTSCGGIDGRTMHTSGASSAPIGLAAFAVPWPMRCRVGGAGDARRTSRRSIRVAPVRERGALGSGLGQLTRPHPCCASVTGTGPARLLARIGKTDPTSLESYRAHGGYQALARAIELGPERVIARSDRLEAAGPWRRRVSDRPQMGHGPAPASHAALRGLQRGRERARHVQGSRAA